MQAVMGMDPDKMILIFPAALVAIFIVVTLQKYMCDRPNVYMGLVLPGLCFISATIMAVRPFFVVGQGEHVGLINFCLRMWLTFNIPTIVFVKNGELVDKQAGACSEGDLRAKIEKNLSKRI